MQVPDDGMISAAMRPHSFFGTSSGACAFLV